MLFTKSFLILTALLSPSLVDGSAMDGGAEVAARIPAGSVPVGGPRMIDIPAVIDKQPPAEASPRPADGTVREGDRVYLPPPGPLPTAKEGRTEAVPRPTGSIRAREPRAIDISAAINKQRRADIAARTEVMGIVDGAVTHTNTKKRPIATTQKRTVGPRNAGGIIVKRDREFQYQY